MRVSLVPSRMSSLTWFGFGNSVKRDGFFCETTILTYLDSFALQLWLFRSATMAVSLCCQEIIPYSLSISFAIIWGSVLRTCKTGRNQCVQTVFSLCSLVREAVSSRKRTMDAMAYRHHFGICTASSSGGKANKRTMKLVFTKIRPPQTKLTSCCSGLLSYLLQQGNIV